ncbi:MAG: transketolase family protein [Chlamydiae bacterium]|nr:transketolase family protein [Chlamydiota bacterium]MBI3276466.1 transketolase family protein [Chlamydiota bacterium]
MPLEKKLGAATRDAYGKALIELGKKNQNIVVLDADLSKSTKTELFGKEFPDRFINCGIIEANMVGVASGLALSGKIVFVSSFACFVICKSYDQLRMSIANPMANVKIVASHGGISVGEDGASQQAIEDIALAASLPGFTVILPSDEHCTRELVIQAAQTPGPFYIRTGRPKAPLVHTEKTKFKIGKGVLLREGQDVTLIANGLLVFEALMAAEKLQNEGMSASVIDMHTIKPLDLELLKSECKKTGAIVTAEEHLLIGGLGSAVAQATAQIHPVPIEYVAINDTYAESGKGDELLVKYGLTSRHIVESVRKVFKRKSLR